MINFKALAQQETTLSQLMTGRDKVDIEYVIEKFPEGVTIVAFDFITMEGKTFPVINIKEDDKLFFFGGAVFTNICNVWMSAFGSTNCEEVSKALAEQGGVKVTMAQGKTKKGNSITTVTVVD